ncbi:MAG: response regulator [Planctomycetes bacterium]|nr:response regulator [Planctomycetota bacterium]
MSNRPPELKARAFDEILDELDSAAGNAGQAGQAGPSVASHPYRTRALRVELRDRDGRDVAVLVQGRTLSERQLTVLATTKLPPRRDCVIFLIDTEGGWAEIPGTVSWCRRLEQHLGLWDVGFDLAARVDLVRFAPAAWRARVLVADDSSVTQRLLSRIFAKYHCDVTCVPDGRQAVEAALAGRFDLTVLDLEMPELNGIETARELRAGGYLWPLAVVTASSGEESRQACMEAGCDAFIVKPPSERDIRQLLRSLRPSPLISALTGERDAVELIDEFVAELHKSLADMAAMFREADYQALERLVRRVRVEAPSCGFPGLAQLANRVESAIQCGFPRSDLRRVVGELLRNGWAARPATRFDPD